MNLEKQRYLEAKEQSVREHYGRMAARYGAFLKKRAYYYARKGQLLRHLAPKPGRVSDISIWDSARSPE